MRFKLFDSGECSAKVAAGKASWSDNFVPEGDTHCANATIPIDYDYQLEMSVQDIFDDLPYVVRVECPDLGRVWVRES